jgi:GH15 family glucan-1,4-alpha-glucosidase
MSSLAKAFLRSTKGRRRRSSPLSANRSNAPTTSLPEFIGGPRNWDYRFCWLRDATLTLLSLMNAGYYDEAKMWRDWLLRAAAGSPRQIQIMYGLRGAEHRVVDKPLSLPKIKSVGIDSAALQERASLGCARCVE